MQVKGVESPVSSSCETRLPLSRRCCEKITVVVAMQHLPPLTRGRVKCASSILASPRGRLVPLSAMVTVLIVLSEAKQTKARPPVHHPSDPKPAPTRHQIVQHQELADRDNAKRTRQPNQTNAPAAPPPPTTTTRETHSPSLRAQTGTHHRSVSSTHPQQTTVD